MSNATALSGSSKVQVNIEHKKLDPAKLNEILDKFSINVGPEWSFGTGVNKANMLYHATLTATNVQAAVDISGTAIQDAFGDNCDFSLLKLLYIKNTDATEDLLLGGDAAHIDIFDTILTDILHVKPVSGILLWVDPTGIDVTTNKNLKIQAESASITYDIVMMGEKT